MEPWERGECIAHIPKSMRAGIPGPGKYNTRPEFEGQTPVIRMKGRHSLAQETNNAPYYNLPSSIGKTTKINMHGKSDTKNKFTPPGPSYIPPAFGSDAKKIGISPPVFNTSKSRRSASSASSRGATSLGRRRNPDETPGPGPGKYSTRAEFGVPKSSHGVRIKGTHDFRYLTADSPGPAAYKPKYEKVMPAAPKYKMKARPKAKDPEVTAGYRNIGSTLGGPRFSMKARASDDICII
ncbi:Outer dense fiber protein 3-like protein 2 [Tritrichomonas musculus]|uniref:Outer dense fiber protein 3-like protein 2 n=1 Tax=Tritrichomonas musculus TaxID=1915356 RepID=A0ABR2K926_9EUKA